MIIKKKFTRKHISSDQEGKNFFKKGIVPLNPFGVNDNIAAKAAVIATISIRIRIDDIDLLFVVQEYSRLRIFCKHSLPFSSFRMRRLAEWDSIFLKFQMVMTA